MPATDVFVSDQVWQKLAQQRTMRLPRPPLRFVLAAAVLAALAGALLVAFSSGLVTNRIRVTGVSSDGGRHSCRLHVSLRNEGWFDVESLSVRALDASFVVSRQPVQHLRSGGRTTVTLSRDTVCGGGVRHADPHHVADIALRLHRATGTTTQMLAVYDEQDSEGLTFRW